MTDHAKLFDLVIDRAPKLREAGVLELSVDGLTVKLASFEPEVDSVSDAPRRTSMWDDPDLGLAKDERSDEKSKRKERDR